MAPKRSVGVPVSAGAYAGRHFAAGMVSRKSSSHGESEVVFGQIAVDTF